MPVPALIAGVLAFAKGVKIVLTSTKFMKLLGIYAATHAAYVATDAALDALRDAITKSDTEKKIAFLEKQAAKKSKLRDRNLAKLANEVRKAVNRPARRNGIEITVDDLVKNIEGIEVEL